MREQQRQNWSLNHRRIKKTSKTAKDDTNGSRRSLPKVHLDLKTFVLVGIESRKKKKRPFCPPSPPRTRVNSCGRKYNGAGVAGTPTNCASFSIDRLSSGKWLPSQGLHVPSPQVGGLCNRFPWGRQFEMTRVPGRSRGLRRRCAEPKGKSNRSVP